MAQKRKIKRGKGEESLWKKKGYHATWRREDSKMSGAKSRHLRCYTPKIRSQKRAHKSHKNTHAEFLYYKNSMCKYMKEGTLYIGMSDLESKMSEEQKGKGRGAA